MKGVCKVLQSIMSELMTLFLLVTFCDVNFSTLICKDTLFFTASENSSSTLCILLTYADNVRIQSSVQVGHIGMYNGVKSLQICKLLAAIDIVFPRPDEAKTRVLHIQLDDATPHGERDPPVPGGLQG